MSNGSQAICAAAPWPAWSRPVCSLVPRSRVKSRTTVLLLLDNKSMPEESPDLRSARLRKHADYQRVYKESRKHFSQSMSFFFRSRTEHDSAPEGPRVGLTSGRVLGKAVERNRIKRRMREVVRLNLNRLPQTVDVVLHPRKSVIDMEFAKLNHEIVRIFSMVTSHVEKDLNRKNAGERL